MATKLRIKTNLRKKVDSLAEANLKAVSKGQDLIDKKYVALKATGEDGGEFEGQILPPTDEQLMLINQYTRTPKSANEVSVLPTFACNDMADRDDDQFSTQTIDDITMLPEGLNPLGKSYMISHDYKQLPIGRIFDQGTETKDGVKHLRLWAYIPNTEANKSFLENVDYGIYWAVSVGLVLEQQSCNICQSPMMNFWGMSWCVDKGHEKSYFYDPKEEVKDGDWATPISPEDKNAVKCVRVLSQPRDFYELSQVWLGAQYMAELEKGALGGAIKAASKSTVPLIGLSSEDVKKLPEPKDYQQIREAMRKHQAEFAEDGTLMWTSDDGLVYTVDDDGEILCLGKSNDAGEEEEVADEQEVETTEEGGEEVEETEEEAATEVEAEATPEEEEAEEAEEPEATAEGEPAEDASDKMAKQAVLKAATKANLPTSIIDEIVDAKGNGLSVALQACAKRIEESDKQIASLTDKAVLGEEYIKELKADTISWYVKANKEPEEAGVKTNKVEKLLTMLGDNVELIKDLRDDYKKTAQLKFPAAVRRSSFENDPNKADELQAPGKPSKESASKVKRIHG